MKRVLLINMPFAEPRYPSLALGLFTGLLAKQGIPCDVEYLNILFTEMVGWEDYKFIGEKSGLFAGEQMFASFLFGNYIPDDSCYYRDIVATMLPGEIGRLARMKTMVEPFLRVCLESIPWHNYDIIGFTSLFEQHLPALTLAYRVKTIFPNKIIVFGGANCEEKMGITLHRCFPFVDFVCSGEADHTFPELVKRLSDGHPVHDLAGLVYRGSSGQSVYTGPSLKISNLDELAIPDFDSYYRRFYSSYLSRFLDINLLMETSRGCWWREKVGCTFCGLNGENEAFRSKSDARILQEIHYLVERYDTRFIRIVDNVINPRYFESLLPQLAELNLNVYLFFELRPNVEKADIKKLIDAKVSNIQAGLENLSTHILKLMRKGSTALRNVQLLKWCKQYGIFADWNIIFGFPGEEAVDYARNLELASVITHLNPPSGYGPLRMDRFSYNFNRAPEVGFINLRPMHIYKYLYPFSDEVLFDLVYYFSFDYRREIDSGGYIPPLTALVNRWKNKQDQLYSSEQDDSVFIYDTRPVAIQQTTILQGVHRYIYEYCDKSRTIEHIRQWLNQEHGIELDEKQVKMILDEFIARKLMIIEGEWYLSLAIMTYIAEFEEKS